MKHLTRWLRQLMDKRKPQQAARETTAQRAWRLRPKFNPTTGEPLITRRYRDACIDEIVDSF